MASAHVTVLCPQASASTFAFYHPAVGAVNNSPFEFAAVVGAEMKKRPPGNAGWPAGEIPIILLRYSQKY